jgi:hypothetical protein
MHLCKNPFMLFAIEALLWAGTGGNEMRVVVVLVLLVLSLRDICNDFISL